MPLKDHDGCLYRLLCADERFFPPDPLDDQVWELSVADSEPVSLSLPTTYGLRAKRIHLFPQFSLSDKVALDPATFQKPPEIQYSSTNLASLRFSPFTSIDVEYRVWVPTSQIIMGQFTFTNSSTSTISLGLDCLVKLMPLANGSPMQPRQVGLNTVLSGECSGLFPVLYLTGGAFSSLTSWPGLGTRQLLLPSTKKQVTWVLASQKSLDLSFQSARQYSSKNLDAEQLRIEMSDALQKVNFQVGSTGSDELLNHSQTLAFQLIMPPVQQLKFATYVNDRSPDLGYCPAATILEVNPAWSGQALPEIWSLSQCLLSGRVETVRGILQNVLDGQLPDGRIDLLTSANRKFIGRSSLPLLCSLAMDIQTYTQDVQWLESVFPSLLRFYKTWVSRDDHGNLQTTNLDHPVQLGFLPVQPEGFKLLANLWCDLKSSDAPLLLTLLLRETISLLTAARLLNREPDITWLESVQSRLADRARQLAKVHLRLNKHAKTRRSSRRIKILRRNGSYQLDRSFPAATPLTLVVSCPTRLPPEFICVIRGQQDASPRQWILQPADFQLFGDFNISTDPIPLTTLQSIEVTHLPPGCSVELRRVDLPAGDLTPLLLLSTGVPSKDQADQLLQEYPPEVYFTPGGLSLLPADIAVSSLPVPGFLVGQLIDGLLRYGYVDLAEKVFNGHFVEPKRPDTRSSGIHWSQGLHDVDDLVPVRLFLKILGLAKLTNSEVILTHFSTKPYPITVKYNKVELILTRTFTEIHKQSGEVVHLDTPGSHRVILE